MDIERWKIDGFPEALRASLGDGSDGGWPSPFALTQKNIIRVFERLVGLDGDVKSTPGQTHLNP